MDGLVPQSIGWYGKLPCRGDFVGRGLPRAWLRSWDDWLQRSLASAAPRLGATLREHLLAMSPWQCVVLPAQSGLPAWCGVVAPSTDRVGRTFPLLLAEACDAAALDGVELAALQARARYLNRWLSQSRTLSSPREFEMGAAQLGSTPWTCIAPDHAQADDSFARLRAAWPVAASFWWRVDPAGDMHAPLAEPWPPRESLILDMLGRIG